MYQTRKRSSSGLRRGSRVDRRKTRVSFLGYLKDSDDSGSDTAESASDTADSVPDPADSVPGTADTASSNAVHSNSDDAEDRQDEKQPAGSASDEEEACAAPRAGRKRSSTAVFADSSSSSDSDEVGRPVRKVLPKKRMNVQRPLSESDAEEEGDGARPEREKEKKRERRAKLLELSQRRRAKTGRPVRGTAEGSGKDDDTDDDEDATCTLLHSSEEGTESDSLKDFIVEDEEQKDGDEGESQERSLLSYHLPQMALGSQRDHFELVVKALLINARDQTFLQSLYDGVRTKRYAREMQKSLHHLDERTVIPRLVNLKQRSRWSERYKERVECYPNVKILSIGRCDRICEACQLHRHTRFCVHLSGQLYDGKTLQEDTFMPNDTQVFRVGIVCANRTEVYHQLKHFKYHLSRRCKAELEKEEEAPVKDMVGKAFSRLRACGWIRQQYEDFEDHLNKADYFQEEKLD
ncbi:coiled-coil domain-containing protein 82 [Brienomyrus brachyistius]|uniref:coiled-coil domain-containing protein 82 n=1 Tax=Brienomyrus brachyistius TaxID=42636 RepID=UPI0020B1CE9A|nr:coiled-coil domain-containing protein 82 [Brienomyrus brachyistius]